MPIMDTLQGGLDRILPKRKASAIPSVLSGGVGNGGVVSYDDDMIISKPAIVIHISQSFFNFLAMACFASVAAFQAKWHVGPSGLSGFAIFLSVLGIILPLFMMFVPVVYEKYDRLARLARALKEPRVGFILTGAGTTFSLLIAFITTISAWTEPGCKNADNDPNAGLGSDFKNALPGWCDTKKAGAVFFWLAVVFWFASVVLLVIDWRRGNLRPSTRPRDPPFTQPDLEEGSEPDEEPEETGAYQPVAAPAPSSRYDNSNTASSPFADSNRYSGAASSGYGPTSSGYVSPPSAPRQSIDAYGAFSDPAPSGFGGVSHDYAPAGADSTESPRVSRTMQYADPYAAVRASLGAQGPPSYSAYSGYQ